MEHLVVPTFVLMRQRAHLEPGLRAPHGHPAREVIGTRDHWRAFYDSPGPVWPIWWHATTVADTFTPP
jgi:hypothetical protein